jgi:hypothetical protein
VFSDGLNLGLEPLNASADEPPVCFKLRFSGASGADAGTEPFQVAPLPGQAWEKVLVLRQLHLQTTLVRARSPGENIQNQGHTVDDLHLEPVFQVLLLKWREFIVNNDDIIVGSALEHDQFVELTRAQIVAFGGYR